MAKVDIDHIKFADINWSMRDSGLHVGVVYLYPDQQLDIEPDWVIHGPSKALVLWYPASRWVRVRTSPLPKRMFDIDNALEYPCQSCGAPRLSPCVGDKHGCTWRVFYMRGGQL